MNVPCVPAPLGQGPCEARDLLRKGAWCLIQWPQGLHGFSGDTGPLVFLGPNPAAGDSCPLPMGGLSP